MKYGEAVNFIRTTLKNAGIEDYAFETNCISEDILGMNALKLNAERDVEADEKKVSRAIELALKRAGGYPLQYLLGEWEFYGLKFRVGEGVLIPRPDTETLIEVVLQHFAGQNNASPEIIDLCSGSGCIAVTLKKQLPKAVVSALELSSDAMPYLVGNIRTNGVDVKLYKGDVMDGRMLDNFMLPDSPGDYRKIDCIVSNPPYLTAKEMNELSSEVKCEPECALSGGSDGLKFYRIITCLWSEILMEGGLLAFEIGYEQGQAVSEILSSAGFSDVKITKDLAGNDRVVSGLKS